MGYTLPTISDTRV